MTGISTEGWTALAIITLSFTAMLRSSQKIPLTYIYLTATVLLVLTGCIDMKAAMAGCSSSTVLLLVGLLIVVGGLEATGFMNLVAKYMLRSPKSLNSALATMMIPASCISSVMSNTAVTALFIGMVKPWAKKHNIALSKLLIPLSYAAILGGTLLLVGNPLNLIIAEQYEEATGETLGITFPTLAGIFCVATGVASVLLLKNLLPLRKSPEDELGAEGTVTELKVPANCPIVGETISESALKDFLFNDEEVKLLGIVRFDGYVVKDVREDEFIMGGDTLLFTGPKEKIVNRGRLLGMRSNTAEKEISEKDRRKLPISISLLIAAILLPSFDILSLPMSMITAAIIMIATGCLKGNNFLKAINGDVIVILVCSAAYGKAVEETGLAQFIANGILTWCESDALLALICICTLGTFLTEFLSNVGCAAILTPIALKISMSLGANPQTFCLGLMISCCCSFATPTGTVPNLLVYAPGGYKFTDYIRIGLPMNIILLVANIFITTTLQPL